MHKTVRPADTNKFAYLAHHPKRLGTSAVEGLNSTLRRSTGLLWNLQTLKKVAPGEAGVLDGLKIKRVLENCRKVFSLN